MSNILRLFIKATFSFFVASILITPAAAKIIGLQEITPIPARIIEGAATFIINSKIDLHGDTLILPPISVLSFEGTGGFYNGTIVGSKSIIKAPEHEIFENITVQGEWSNSIVYSDWFVFPHDDSASNETFSNLMKLCTGDNYTHFYLQKGKYYVSVVPGSAPILVPSNVYWHNEGEIFMLPNKETHYSLIYLNNVINVTIDGGTFIGDVKTHFGENGEWGHGIKCGGAQNVSLKNFISSFHWGDGIDLIEGLDETKQPTINCNHIRIDNVKCLNNRRQGLSIEAANNVEIINSEFASTGTPKSTRPGAGVDIEPWKNNNFKVRNITFRNCSMHHNSGFDFQCEPNLHVTAEVESFNNIIVENCTIGNMRVQFTNGIQFDSCQITKLLLQNSQNVIVNNTKITKLEKGPRILNFSSKGCDIKTAQFPKLTIMCTTLAWLALLAFQHIRK